MVEAATREVKSFCRFCGAGCGVSLTIDATVRRGVVQMNHGWGKLPDESADYAADGANTNLLISVDRACEPINAMVRMSAIPVNILPRGDVLAG